MKVVLCVQSRWEIDDGRMQIAAKLRDFQQGGLQLRTWMCFLQGNLLVRFVLKKGSVTAKGEKMKKVQDYFISFIIDFRN